MFTAPIPSFPLKTLVPSIFALLPLLLVAGCYDFQINGAYPGLAVTISAQPASVPAGTPSMLTVVAKNAVAVVVTGSDGSSFDFDSGGGTKIVSPSDTTTYTAIATGIDGKKTARVAVKVTSTAAPAVTITADPEEINPGESSVLTVDAKNASQVIVTGTNGSRFVFPATGGTKKVSPKRTTTYTATATGVGGKRSASVTVKMRPPVVTISASPTKIYASRSSTLTVTAKDATEVVLTGTDGTRINLPADGGTHKVTPGKTATYTATAVGRGGKASAETTVTVVPYPAPRITATAYPTSIAPGNSSILTIAAKNATQVILTGSNGSKYTLSATGGKQAVSPAASTTYTATASGEGGKASATVTVTVMPNPPPTVEISANPASIKAGNSSTLTVTAVHATSVSVKGSDGTSHTMKPNGGAEAVSPSATTVYTATAVGPGGSAKATTTITVTANPAPSITIVANPTAITAGNSSALKVTATNATQVTIAGTNGSSYTLPQDGGSQAVSPTATTTYTATATGPGGTDKASTTVTVEPSTGLKSIDHVIFMLQENHSFDNYFGMLNPYRAAHGWDVGDDGVAYSVDGIDDKLTKISNPDDEGTSYSLFKFISTCIDDDSSDWLASYGDVNRYDFLTTRPILENGFVHTAEGYAKSCAKTGSTCGESYTDLTGRRAMGYYDEGFLNYYYYMASQFALSDRWFSPISSKSIDNRIATFTGGTTQGLTKDPGNDHLPQLNIANIFQELDQAKVSWKIYYTVTQGFCLEEDDCPGGGDKAYPATDFSNLSYSFRYLHKNPSGAACTPPTQASSVVGDATNSFCIDPERIAPLSAFFSDLKNGTLPSFAFIEAGYGRNDEHPGSGQSVLLGQAQVANIINTFMDSPEWSDSVFFLSYDEGGGPYDHVPPVPGHSNAFTDASLAAKIPDISAIAVNSDSYKPCYPAGGTPTLHCDLVPTDPGAKAGDAPAVHGFAAQLGFRLPNMVISPFTRRHYVSHTPMDHTAIIKFVENRFIGSAAHLTSRDAAQPSLLDFFDFANTPWATPPIPPAPVTAQSLGYNPCTPAKFAP